MITMIISPSWGGPVGEREYEAYGHKVRLVSNKLIPEAVFVIDVGVPFKGLAKEVDPNKRIYVPTEPSLILGLNESKAKRIADYYKGAILAWHKDLTKFSQTIPFSTSLCWVRNGNPKNKIFGISGFISGKSEPEMKGYALRHKILKLESKIKIPSIVWNFRKIWQGKSHKYPAKSKAEGMKYMYHFAIENCQEEGYFTEKIMDCFRTYSIPLYWGDPSICSKFNPKSIIILKEKNVIEQINALTQKDYNSKMVAILDNYNRAGKYMLGNQRVIETILKYKY